jgi:succinate-semialdehyde dehydrogenase/glutarate-semialdehyde dehydrogenase
MAPGEQVSYPPIQLLIDGAWTGGSSGICEPVLNPSTGQEIGRVPHASEADIDAALAAAARGFAAWSIMPVAARTRLLLAASRLITERAPQIARIMTLEQGKLHAEALGEAQRSASIIEWDAAEGQRAYGRVVPVDEGTQLTVIRQPIGPVAGFTPWNFPAGSVTRKIAPALAAGCSIILKASEETPGTAMEIVRCFHDAGIPPGVVNLLFGNPAQISERLIASPVTRLVAFTGSVPVGKHLAELAARVMKPAIMELGGHAPVIVCEDADFDLAVRACAMGKFMNGGQVCTSASRFFIHRSLYSRFVAAMKAHAVALAVGDGFDQASRMGPLANARRVDALDHLVQEAVSQGARLETGGHRLDRPGCWFAPTVLADVPETAEIMQIEPFGPVICAVPFDDLDDAIARANALPYGLAAYAFTRAAKTAVLLGRKLDAGIISINSVAGSTHEAPSGGVKESGYGREGGAEALSSFLVTKRILHKL